MRVVGRAGVVVAAAAFALALAACTSGTPQAAPSAPPQTAWTEQPAGGASLAAQAGAFAPKGSAADNKAVFDTAIRKVLASDPKASGTAVAAALKSAGFPMSATQVSASKTSAKLQPGSISVGVKIGQDCLIGQWGAAVDGYQSSVAPALGASGCLVGGIPVVG